MRAVMLTATLALAATLTACASGESFSDRLAGPSRVRGDAEGVTVFRADSRGEALPLAVGHCARFGKSAQFDGRAETGFRFRCVAG